MSKQTKVRAPQQTRSIDKKEKLLSSAYSLFCEIGYYKTTTPEIAKRAGISIGSLYSYFKDKNDLFLAVLDRYYERFGEIRIQAIRDLNDLSIPLRDSFRSLLVRLIEIHKESEALNIEMRILAYSDPQVRERADEQRSIVRAAVLDSLRKNSSRLRVTDLEAAAEVIDELVGGIVHRIAFKESDVDDDRILDAAVDAICAYSMPGTA
jgi:AcrR family transcriptional regulator